MMEINNLILLLLLRNQGNTPTHKIAIIVTRHREGWG